VVLLLPLLPLLRVALFRLLVEEDLLSLLLRCCSAQES
jgi:hypothetical protein